jgi:hypothetical protein
MDPICAGMAVVLRLSKSPFESESRLMHGAKTENNTGAAKQCRSQNPDATDGSIHGNPNPCELDLGIFTGKTPSLYRYN